MKNTKRQLGKYLKTEWSKWPKEKKILKICKVLFCISAIIISLVSIVIIYLSLHNNNLLLKLVLEEIAIVAGIIMAVMAVLIYTLE